MNTVRPVSMNLNYIIILIVMAIACYFLFIRKPKAKPSDDAVSGVADNEKDA